MILPPHLPPRFSSSPPSTLTPTLWLPLLHLAPSPPIRYTSIPSWQLHLLLPPSPLSVGWFPQLWWVRGRWPENWPLGERWAILVLLGSWLIIGVSDRGKINQGGNHGECSEQCFLHIGPDGWNYTCQFLVALLPNWLSTLFFPHLPPSDPLLSFLSLCPHSCVSGLLKGFFGEIPVIFVFSLFSPQPATLLPACMHLGESLKGWLNFHVNWELQLTFCMCSVCIMKLAGLLLSNVERKAAESGGSSEENTTWCTG